MKCYRTFFSGPFIASPDISCTAYTCPHLRHFKLTEAKGKVLTFLPQTRSFPCSCIWVGSSTLGRFLQPQTGCILDSLFLISNLIQSPSAIKYSSNPSALFCHCGHHPHLSRGGHNSLPPGFPLLLWHPSNPLAGMSSDLQTWTRHSLAWNHSPTSYCWFQSFLSPQHPAQPSSSPHDICSLVRRNPATLWGRPQASSLFQRLCLICFLRLAWLGPPHSFFLVSAPLSYSFSAPGLTGCSAYFRSQLKHHQVMFRISLCFLQHSSLSPPRHLLSVICWTSRMWAVPGQGQHPSCSPFCSRYPRQSMVPSGPSINVQ